MEINPVATRTVSTGSVAGSGPVAPKTGNSAPVRVQVQALSLVGFASRDQITVVNAFRDELVILMGEGRTNPKSGADRWGRLSVHETRTDAIGRGAARELARRLQQ